MRHDRHGWWLEEAGADPPQPALSGDLTTDVVVVGGGYTGLWSAWWLLQADPQLRVVLLESERCGHGPSGRNGGFATSYWFALPELRDAFGDRQALALARSSEAAVAGIGDWCAAEGVDAHFVRGGLLDVATSAAHDETVGAAARASAELGADGSVLALSTEEVQRRCALPSARAGTLVPTDATVQPALLALGLRRRLIERGLTVRERSPVRRVDTRLGEVQVHTDDGRVRAARCILAMNSASVALPPLRRRLTVASSHMVVTEPVPEVLDELGWTGGEAITDARTFLHYFRTTRDGRIAFGFAGGRLGYGGRRSAYLEQDARIAATTASHLVSMIPMLAGRRITNAWGGPIDVSPTHVPVVDTLPGDRVHFAAGFTGNGVGPSYLVGQVLADLALDRRTERSALPIVSPEPKLVPPEPWRYLGGALVRAAYLRRERLEGEGRRADPITVAVTALPRLLGVRLAR